jgi:hypothetical protein
MVHFISIIGAENLNGRDHLGQQCIYGRKILKQILKEMGCHCVNQIQLPSGSMLGREIFNQLRNWAVLTEVSGPRSYLTGADLKFLCLYLNPLAV